MTNQNLRYLLVVATALVLSGCASHPPAQIVGGRYVNFEYGYSIEIPKDWDVHEQVPHDISHHFRGVNKKKVGVLIINKETSGLIILWHEKANVAFRHMIVGTDSQVDEMEESIREEIDPNLKIKDIKVESKSQNHYLTHYRYIGNRSSFRPEEIYAVSLEIEKSIGYVKEYIDMFIYPCDGEKSCFTTIFLMSPRDKSDRNLPTFQKLSDSFLGHDNSSP